MYDRECSRTYSVMDAIFDLKCLNSADILLHSAL